MPMNHSRYAAVASVGKPAKRCTIVSSAELYTLHINEGIDLCITLASITRIAMTWSCTANIVDSVSEWRCCLTQLKLLCLSTMFKLTKEKYWLCSGLASKADISKLCCFLQISLLKDNIVHCRKSHVTDKDTQ